MKHPSQEIDNEARADDYLRNRDFKGKGGTYTTLEVRQLMCGFAKKEVQRAQSRMNRDKGSDRNHGNAHGKKGPTTRQTQKAQETISALGFAMNLIVSVDKQTAPYGWASLG